MSETTTPTVALRARPVLTAWALTVSVDLLFNAGILSGLFNQEREPALLADEVLFRRIPVAYLALAVGVTALAWLFDKTDVQGWAPGGKQGAVVGSIVAVMGVINLWTAIDMTGAFVIGAAAVQIVEFASAGAYLGAFREVPHPRHLTRTALSAALVTVVAAVIIQNLG